MKLRLPLNGIQRALRQSQSTSCGLFGNPLLKTPNDVEQLAGQVEAQCTELAGRIVRESPLRASDKTSQKTVALVDNLSNAICSAADLTECVRNMHSDEAYVTAAESAMHQYTNLVETLNTMPELHAALKNSLETECDRIDEVDRRTIDLLLEDFENSGVHLEKTDRKEFVRLSGKIFAEGARFCERVDEPVVLSMRERIQYGIKSERLFSPIYNHPEYRIRRFSHARYFEHRNDQESNLCQLISARDKLAKLTGFQTYSHRAQRHMILGSYENIQRFLGEAKKKMVPIIGSEKEEVKKILCEHSKDFDLTRDKIGEPDVLFASSVRQGQLLGQLDRVSDYFHLETMISGFETVVNKLYGLYFRALLPDASEVWPGNVLKLNVYSEEEDGGGGGRFLGTIYLDIDDRPRKKGSDCHFTVRCSKLLENGEFQTPIVVLSFSMAPPNLQFQTAPTAALFESVRLSQQQAENFFHEMGHAIHSILGRTRYQHVAGTRCPTDFAEVPSNLMECYFDDPRVLSSICKDKSGRPLSFDQAEVLVKSRNLFNAFYTLQQVLYSLVDIELHGNYANEVINGKISTTALFKRLNEETLPGFDKTDNYAYHHRMTHLVTYGAKYYSYLVAKSSASLIYQQLFARDPFSRENGLKWAKVQSLGGEYPSEKLINFALGRTPTVDELATLLSPQKI